MRFTRIDDPEECGCAPTPAEQRAFAGGVTRRGALTVGAFGLVAAGALAAPFAPVAFAIAGYPSWDDVQRAKANEASKNAEVARIEQLINDLTADVAYKQGEAERLGLEYQAAQEAYEAAVERADSLQAQADAEEARALEAAQKAGRVASQLYRNGGDDTSLELFFSGSAATADDLLARLGTMDKLLAANQAVYTDAVMARNNAQSLSDQASVARDARDELKRAAEAKMVEAQAAAEAAQAALAAQTEHLGTLQAQLAALKDTTAQTVAGYQAGVEEERRQREERERRAREEAERRAREEAERIAKENAARPPASGGGGGGGGGGNSGGGGGGGGGQGWVRPHGGWISSWFGNRGTICSNGYCSGSGHRGIDFANGCGAYIYAAAAGTVVFAAYSGSWGNYIKIDHGGGIVTGYAHIRPGGYAVGYGQWVSAGQVIAYAGNTGASDGCHLHFEVYSGGVRIDPAPFLANRGVGV
ncbi:M23 family metallopeptidase [Microbacterium sp. zg.Y625]|uniref:peptidoglycan DD-metalloendopeptidase family protein n=1 Tax=Microbacterium jiangjiandongii TaxID=3049071 RepID=UPI00214C7859|nr:M23 family metallopeptidase [Microbacterium sp. zg.Y625]MCR2794314.1 M23 family metallopeptidase [Microbacterium sp. zg.Y625]